MDYLLTMQSGEQRGMSWRFGQRALLVGRSEECDIVLSDPSVSRRHCEMRWSNDALLLHDLGSRNPPVLNGARVSEAVLAPGDEVRVGSAVFLIGTVQINESAANDGQPMNDSVTVELQGRDLFAQELNGRETPWPGTLNDYALLFRFARGLARVSTLITLEKEVADLARRRFTASVCWLLPKAGASEMMDRISPAVHDAIEASLEACRASVVSVQESSGMAHYFVAPARNGNRCAGVVVARSVSHDGDGLDEELLIFAAMADLVGPTLSNVLRQERITAINRMRESVSLGSPPIIGQSAVMDRLRRRIREAASMPVHTIIVGATGTGKSLVAKNFQYYCDRTKPPFVAFDCCPGDPAQLDGLFQRAQGGILYLDHVDELTPEQQRHLLQLILAYEEPPNGVRILSSTSNELKDSSFRADLYHRLCGMRLSVPPLNARVHDIADLAHYFLESVYLAHPHIDCRFGVEAISALSARRWPGNVQELRNVVEHAAHRCTSGEIGPQDLGDAEVSAETPLPRNFRIQTLAALEQAHVAHTLEYCGGNYSKAARMLGISRSTLYSKVRALE